MDNNNDDATHSATEMPPDETPKMLEGGHRTTTLVTSFHPSAHYAKPFPDISKIEVFNGNNFKRWQERVTSILNIHGVAFALTELKPDMQHLDLAGLCGITDVGLLPLLEKCEGVLIKVNLSGCFNVTDKAISALVRLNSGTLEVLNLDGSRKVTYESLVAISDNCFVLNDLDMSRCAITDSGIAALSEASQPNLQILSLSGCSKVTDKSAPFLGCLARNLLGLNLQHCHSISNSMVESLTEISWRCDIIS